MFNYLVRISSLVENLHKKRKSFKNFNHHKKNQKELRLCINKFTT